MNEKKTDTELPFDYVLTQDDSQNHIADTQELKNEKKLETLAKYLKDIQNVVPLDCALTVTDKERYRYLLSGKDIKIPDEVLNSVIPENDSPYKAIHTGQNALTFVPAEQMGFPYESTSAPIRDDNGTIIGALGLAISLDNRDTLQNMVSVVASSSEETLSTVEELAASAEQLSAHEVTLEDLINDIHTELAKTNDILNIINSVANTSNILGLNASIEAARAGEAGKGFAVVADEIRKMSKNSSDGVKKIENILSIIKAKIENIREKISETNAIATQQAAATEEISSAMQELAISAEKLQTASENVVG